MSAPMQFDRPAPPGDQFQCETHVGALCVFEVLEHVPPMMTKVSDKPQDAIRANVHVVSPQGQVAESFHNTLLFPRMLVARLQQSVGRTVLGVLTGEPGVKRDGRNVPYDLADPTDPMYEAASRAMAAYQQERQRAQMQSAPAASDPWAAQQAPPGWGGPAQQPASPWGQQAPAQQGPPPGWGQQPQPQQGPPPGWGQQPATAPAQQPAGGWGGPPAQPQQPAQQPAGGGWGQQQPQQDQQELPPWEQQPAAPWGGQQ
jgi:hypothetical protein